MKKLIVILSAAFVFLTLAACGTGNNKTGTTTTTNSANTGVVGEAMDDIENGVLGAEDAIMNGAEDDVVGGEDDIIGDEREDSIMANDDIAADNSINSSTTTQPSDSAGNERRMTEATKRKTAETKEGELNRLASLVGKKDSTVLSELGGGRQKETGGGAFERRFDISFSGSSEKAVFSYSGRGMVKKITITPAHKGLAGSLLALNKEFGEPDKISSDGLSYDYIAQWKRKNVRITLHKWDDIITITME